MYDDIAVMNINYLLIDHIFFKSMFTNKNACRFFVIFALKCVTRTTLKKRVVRCTYNVMKKKTSRCIVVIVVI